MPNPDIQIAADPPAWQLALFKQFVEDSGQALGMATLTGRIFYVNASMCQLLGQAAAQLHQSDVFSFYEPSIAKDLRTEILPIVQRDGHWLGELNLVTATGRTIPAIQNIFLLRDASGQPQCYANVCTDISERIYLEQALRDYRDHLEELVTERTAELRASNAELSAQIACQQRTEKERARLTAILDSTVDLVATAHPRGQVFYLNAGGLRLLGLSENQDLKNFRMADAHPAWAWRIIEHEAIPTAVECGVWRGLTAVQNQAGREIPVSQVIMAHRDARGQLEYISTIMRDITERVRTEEALQIWMRRYDFLVEASNQVVYDYSVGSRAITWGRSCEKVLGYTLAEMAGGLDQWAAMLHPDDRAATLSLLTAAEQACSFWDTRYRLRHKAGHYLWVRDRGYFLPDASGKAERQLGLVEDISGLVQAEAAWRASEEKFVLAFRHSPSLMAMTTLNEGRYLEVNERLLKTLGYDRAEVIGHTSVELNYWFDAADRAALLRELESNGKLEDCECRFRTKAGEVRWGLVSAVRLELDSQACVLSQTIDITERKRLEENFLQAQKLETIGRLAGGVAHDFNNILTAICGNAELALLQPGLEPKVGARLKEIEHAAASAAELTKQLLAFSRKQLIKPEVIDLNALIHNMGRMLERVIGENVGLQSIAQPDLQPIKADPGQLQQIIMNLALNARDAMPEGGRLTIETANVVLAEADCRQMGDLQPGAYVMLAISDTGCGMDATVKRHLFEPFFTTKAHGKGTGLGLATVYGAVKQNRGSIEVYSEAGQGTCIKIYLPKTVEAPAQPPQAAKRDLPGGHETILLAEDDSRVRQLNHSALVELGYQVLASSSGEEALRVSRAHAGQIDLLLSDVVMPGLNGRQLAEQLSAERPGLKVLLASGYACDTVLRQGLLDQKLNFIGKPYSIQKLALRLREILDAA